MPDDDTTPESAQPQERAPARRQYSPEEIAEALAHLAANHGNVKKTARERGMAEATLRLWDNGQRRAGDVSPELCAAKKAQLTRGFDKLALRAVRTCLRKVSGASARDAAIIAGIATEKALLLRGEATTITETRDESRHAELTARYGDSRKVIVVQAAPAGELPPTGTEGASAEGEAPPQPSASSGGSAPIVSRPS